MENETELKAGHPQAGKYVLIDESTEWVTCWIFSESWWNAHCSAQK